jgi:hypothetical protein
MTRLIISPPEPGQYGVVNQISGVYMVRELADTVANIAANEFNLPVTIQRLENPRVEADEHPFEVIYEQLPNTFGFEPKVSLEEEVYEMFKVLIQPEIRQRIEEKKHVIMPKTRWSGLKKEMDVLETYTLMPKRKAKVMSLAAN